MGRKKHNPFDAFSHHTSTLNEMAMLIYGNKRPSHGKILRTKIQGRHYFLASKFKQPLWDQFYDAFHNKVMSLVAKGDRY